MLKSKKENKDHKESQSPKKYLCEDFFSFFKNYNRATLSSKSQLPTGNEVGGLHLAQCAMTDYGRHTLELEGASSTCVDDESYCLKKNSTHNKTQLTFDSESVTKINPNEYCIEKARWKSHIYSGTTYNGKRSDHDDYSETKNEGTSPVCIKIRKR